MGAQVVIAAYRPRAGKGVEFRGLLAQHGPALRSEGLITSRPTLVLEASDGTYLEIFQWASSDAARDAHERAPIERLWDAMGRVADFVSLDTLEESHRPFTHFAPVDL
jgi:hypothetical protein